MSSEQESVPVPTISPKPVPTAGDQEKMLVLNRKPEPARSEPIETTPSQKRRVALVLSGGGAKAAYEVGVIQALETLKIPIDIIVGSSAGALNSLAYALGATGEQLAAMWKRGTRRHIFRTRLWWQVLPFIAILSLVEVLEDIFHEKWLPGETKHFFLEANAILILFLITYYLSHRLLIKLSDKDWSLPKWLERNIHFLKSIYDNAPLIKTTCKEVATLLTERGTDRFGKLWLFVNNCRTTTWWKAAVRLGRRLVIIAVVAACFVFITVFPEVSLNPPLLFLLSALFMIKQLIISPRSREQLLKDTSRKCFQRFQDNKMKECIITACDLDARTDTTFVLLRDPYKSSYFRAQVERFQNAFPEERQTAQAYHEYGGFNYVNLWCCPENVLSAVIASASIPLAFPPCRLELPTESYWRGDVHRFVDGGVGNNTPIKAAEDSGATHIIVVEVNPLARDLCQTSLNSFLDIAVRTTSTLLTSSVEDEFIRFVDLATARGKSPNLYSIRPKSELPISGLDFGLRVPELISWGRQDAENILNPIVGEFR